MFTTHISLYSLTKMTVGIIRNGMWKGENVSTFRFLDNHTWFVHYCKDFQNGIFPSSKHLSSSKLLNEIEKKIVQIYYNSYPASFCITKGEERQQENKWIWSTYFTGFSHFERTTSPVSLNPLSVGPRCYWGLD